MTLLHLIRERSVATGAAHNAQGSDSQTMMRASIRRVCSAVIVRAVGEVDASNLDAWRTLLATTAAATAAPGPLVIDVRSMDFIGSSALSAVAQQLPGCRHRGVDLRLVSNQRIAAKIAAITELCDGVAMYPTVDAALSAPVELVRRLRITPDQHVALINALVQRPQLFPTTDEVDPERADVVIGFITRREHLDLLGPAYAAARSGRQVWVLYPKPGRLGSELYRGQVARAVLRYDVQSIVHVSLGDTWSALWLEPMNDHPAIAAAELDLAWPPPEKSPSWVPGNDTAEARTEVAVSQSPSRRTPIRAGEAARVIT